MKVKALIISIFFCLCFFLFSSSQGAVNTQIDSLYSKLSNDPVVLKYYKADKLLYYRDNSPEKLLKIELSFFYSYSIDLIDSTQNGYSESAKSFIDNFDVNLYDKRRKSSEDVIIYFNKYGIKLTLFRDEYMSNLYETYL